MWMLFYVPSSLSPSLQTVNFPPTSCGNIAERKIASDFRFVDFSESLLEHLGHQRHGQRWEGAKRIESIPGTYSRYAKCQLNLAQSQRTQPTSILGFWTSILGFRILRSMHLGRRSDIGRPTLWPPQTGPGLNLWKKLAKATIWIHRLPLPGGFWPNGP